MAYINRHRTQFSFQCSKWTLMSRPTLPLIATKAAKSIGERSGASILQESLDPYRVTLTNQREFATDLTQLRRVS